MTGVSFALYGVVAASTLALAQEATTNTNNNTGTAAGATSTTAEQVQNTAEAVNQADGWSVWWIPLLIALAGLIWYLFSGRKPEDRHTGHDRSKDQHSGSTTAAASAATGGDSNVTRESDAGHGAASAVAKTSAIRSSLIADDETRAARLKADEARAKAEQAAAERLATARRAAEEAARVRAKEAADSAAKPQVKAETVSRSSSVSKFADVEGVDRSGGKRKSAAIAKTAKPRAAKPKAGMVDDITLVDGIGPKLKKDLAAEGINSLSDLSKLSAAAIKALDAKIPRDADQIADWVAQAKDLLAGKAPRAASDRARKSARK